MQKRTRTNRDFTNVEKGTLTSCVFLHFKPLIPVNKPFICNKQTSTKNR